MFLLDIDKNIVNLTDLFRVRHEAIESLIRYRRKGAQQVVVQHVKVNDGGKAIMGPINQGEGVNVKKWRVYP